MKALSTALLLGVSSLALQSPAALAQDRDAAVRTVDVVTVTARKKEESVAVTPLAVTALEGQALVEAGIDSFDQVLSTVPNAGQSGGIAGGLQGLVSIRGISTLVRFVGLETGVGYYVDGVYAGRPENFNQDLIDINRVEILRGPQGAVFGKNTIAGAINIITNTPDEDAYYTLEGQYGNYNLARLRGIVSGPLSDTVFASASLGYTSRDGVVENLGPNGDLDSLDLFTGRAKLRFVPTNRAEFIFSLDGLRDRGNPSFFEVTDVSFLDDPTEATPFTVNTDHPNFLDRDIWSASLTSNIDVGAGTWTTVLGYRDTSFDAALDDDKLPVTFFVDNFGSDTNFVSLETRYGGVIGERFDYLVGFYYFDQSADNLSNFALGDFLTGVPGFTLPIDLTSSVDTQSYALFFNTNYALTDQLTLELGGRWVSEEKDASHLQVDSTGIFGSTDFAANRTDDDFSPTVSLSYETQGGSFLYARYAEGFKSAGFNTDFVVAGASNLEVEPEEARSFEVGLKTAFLEDRVRANFAAFTTTYDNLQLSQIVGGGVSLNNAAEAEISGFEADFIAVLGDHWDLNGSIGYLDASYDRFTGCPIPGFDAANGTITSTDCSGNTLNLAPEWTAALGVQYSYPVMQGEWITRADWNYRSEVFFEPQNTDRLSGGDRSLVNLRTGYSTERYDVFLWANNLLDEEYVNFADDRSGIFVNTTTAYGEPQTYGITLRIKG